MTFEETVEFLYTKLPYFTRDGKAAIKKDLANTLKLCRILGNPQEKFKCIHIAGTNGKGSVSNMLASVFQEHGYHTGLYTSPHLKDFRERIRVNGEMVQEEFVVRFTEKIIPYLETIQPSFFEITVAMCFDYFAEQKVEYAIIETGLGGRLDSTNVIHPLLSVITNIGMDHADLLGNTLPEIAFEKSGIIKPGIPVVIGESSVETDPVFIKKAGETGSDIYFADHNAGYYNTSIDSDLTGPYQQKNLVTVMQAVEVLEKEGLLPDRFKTARALQNVRKNTQFRGRWEILGVSPKIIADTGHNAHGLIPVFEQLRREKYGKLHIVFGMVKDKDRSEIMKLLPANAAYYFCAPALPRALDPHILLEDAARLGLAGEVHENVSSAFESAKRKAGKEDLIYVGGSTFVVAEIL